MFLRTSQQRQQQRQWSSSITTILFVVVVLLLSSVVVVVQGEVVTSSRRNPEEITTTTATTTVVEEEDPYEFLQEMSDMELELVCTNLGFQLLDPTDPTTGEAVMKTHDHYIEAARQCLSIQEEMEQLLEEHPEIREEYERELEEMLSTEQAKQEQLLGEKEQLEAELAAAAVPPPQQRQQQQQQLLGEETATGGAAAAASSTAGEATSEGSNNNNNNMASAAPIVEDLEDEMILTEEEPIPSSVVDEETTDDDSITDTTTTTTTIDKPLANVPSALPSMEEQWNEIRDALIPPPIQKFLASYLKFVFNLSRTIVTRVRTQVYPQFVVILKRAVPPKWQTSFKKIVYDPLVESQLIPKVWKRIQHDGKQVYGMVKRLVGALVLPLFQKYLNPSENEVVAE